ncbi:MAG: hypothetical protein WKF43_00940 [Acidimicrobiales bacterium]
MHRSRRYVASRFCVQIVPESGSFCEKNYGLSFRAIADFGGVVERPYLTPVYVATKLV